MAAQFRFLQSSDFRLERPCRASVVMPERWKRMLRHATQRSCARLFSAAIEEKVDFVLLAGGLIPRGGAGLSGAVFLAGEFERLADAGIPVIWVCELEGGGDVWPEIVPLPGNVTMLSGAENEPVSIAKGGEEIATIWGIYPGQGRGIEEYERGENFAIAVSPGRGVPRLGFEGYDYWALGCEAGGGQEIVTRNVVRSGSPQGLSISDVGRRGAMVVEVVEGEVERIRQVGREYLRWETERMVVPEGVARGELSRVVADRVEEVASERGNDPCIVEVELSGGGGVLEGVVLEEGGDELLSRCRWQVEHRRRNVFLGDLRVEAGASVQRQWMETNRGCRAVLESLDEWGFRNGGYAGALAEMGRSGTERELLEFSTEGKREAVLRDGVLKAVRVMKRMVA